MKEFLQQSELTVNVYGSTVGRFSKRKDHKCNAYAVVTLVWHAIVERFVHDVQRDVVHIGDMAS